MKREIINFFADSSMSEATPFGSEPDSNPPSEMGMYPHRGDRNYLTREMYHTTRSHQDQFDRRAHAIAMIRQETPSIHHPVLGFQQPAPAFGAPEVSMELHFGGGTAARFAGDDVPFISVWNGVHVVHSYQMDMPDPIPSDGEEHDDDDEDLGTGSVTRNFLDAMDRPLNPDYANQALQLESPELMTVTAPVIDLDPEAVDLELKL